MDFQTRRVWFRAFGVEKSFGGLSPFAFSAERRERTCVTEQYEPIITGIPLTDGGWTLLVRQGY